MGLQHVALQCQCTHTNTYELTLIPMNSYSFLHRMAANYGRVSNPDGFVNEKLPVAKGAHAHIAKAKHGAAPHKGEAQRAAGRMPIKKGK